MGHNKTIVLVQETNIIFIDSFGLEFYCIKDNLGLNRIIFERKKEFCQTNYAVAFYLPIKLKTKYYKASFG